MIVLVFDPLALTLILAANKQFEWARHGTGGFIHDDPEPKYEPDDGPLTEDQIEQIKASVPEPPDDPIPCYKCGTPLEDAPGIGLFCPNKECDVIDNTKGEEPVKFAPIEIEYKFVDEYHEPDHEPDLHVYDNERLVSRFDKIQDTEPPDEDFENGDYDDEVKAAIRKWKDANPDDTIKNQRYKYMRGEISELPWMGLIADNAGVRASHNGFGIAFPDDPGKGDTFVRVDIMPSRLYKYNGSDWITIDKNLSDSYSYDQGYIDHLISKLETGEYDPEMLSDSEREQVTERLQGSK
jgi:hypothetical protein